jgi:hypothetical protein
MLDSLKGAPMPSRYSDDELTRRVTSPGWQLTPAEGGKPVTGTLEEVLKSGHQQRGQAAARIQELETTVELDMIQIEKLWRYLGLPV